MTQAQVEPEVLHAEAVKAMLATTGYPVHASADTIPDNPTVADFPYLAVWTTPGEPLAGDERLRGYAGTITTRHQITIAALAATDAIGAAGRCRRALHRQQPVIAGRVCGDIDMRPGVTPPVRDTTVSGPLSRPIYVTYVTFSLVSTLAT